MRSSILPSEKFHAADFFRVLSWTIVLERSTMFASAFQHSIDFLFLGWQVSPEGSFEFEQNNEGGKGNWDDDDKGGEEEWSDSDGYWQSSHDAQLQQQFLCPRLEMQSR